MSDEQRPEEPAGGDQPSDSGSTRQQQSADARRGGGSSSSTGTGGSSGGGNLGGAGRHRGERRGRHRGERDSQPSPRRTTETSINMDELRELADLIAAQGFTEFELEKEGFRLRLSRNTYPQAAPGTTGGSVIPFPAPSATSAPPTAAAPSAASSASAATTPVAPALAAADAAEDLFKIPSPIVGTFYRAPSPTSDVFVKQGSRVEPETVVCIIEAMKLMNEIQAEVSGTVEKIYVENGQPVEYGQALFGIRK
ncbi:MAG: oxaloacetate decarboxylase (Na+ extruding) subunit alpha [Pyrinomonadaceae bacterium]|jgi:acetyl-CoA carboxylase biotin carboxyl carrier protein|nr:oxaloacetate decarboxylase (Na+ extruding) subunit alpha [Pyrinomonadaceae bacterium]